MKRINLVQWEDPVSSGCCRSVHQNQGWDHDRHSCRTLNSRSHPEGFDQNGEQNVLTRKRIVTAEEISKYFICITMINVTFTPFTLRTFVEQKVKLLLEQIFFKISPHRWEHLVSALFLHTDHRWLVVYLNASEMFRDRTGTCLPKTDDHSEHRTLLPIHQIVSRHWRYLDSWEDGWAMPIFDIY